MTILVTLLPIFMEKYSSSSNDMTFVSICLKKFVENHSESVFCTSSIFSSYFQNMRAEYYHLHNALNQIHVD